MSEREREKERGGDIVFKGQLITAERLTQSPVSDNELRPCLSPIRVS